jgi:ABC-type transporter Mla MlaB component
LARPAPAANDNPATIGGGPGKPIITSSNIPEMMAIENKPLPLMHEIALLYAADYTDAALAMLREAVQEKDGSAPHFWLMLLDLCQLRGMQKEFEDLAMKYVVKFERSPPPWNSIFSQPEGRRKEKREASDYFVLNRVGEANLAAEIKKLVAFAAGQSSVRLDVGKLKKIAPDEAGLLADTLVNFRKAGIAVRFNSVNNLTEMLKEAIRTNSTAEYQACWLLLFEIFQRQGQQEEFEELGLEYAVGFEMSPPSWEALLSDVAPADTPAAEEEEAVVNDFPLRGVISTSSGDQLQQLRNYAAGRDEAHVNMAGVQRIDFDALGAFMELLSGLHHASKKIVLFDVNEMLFPLLEACNVNRFAVILRRKAQ